MKKTLLFIITVIFTVFGSKSFGVLRSLLCSLRTNALERRSRYAAVLAVFFCFLLQKQSFAQTATWALTTNLNNTGNTIPNSIVSATSTLGSGLFVPVAGSYTGSTGVANSGQRVSPKTSGTDGNWPADGSGMTTGVDGRYEEFSIAPTGASVYLDISQVSVDFGTAGTTNQIRGTVYYYINTSNAGFTLATGKKMVTTPTSPMSPGTNVTTTYTAANTIAVPSGSTIYFRVYPFFQSNSTAAGKYAVIRNFTITGTGVTPRVCSGGANFTIDNTLPNTGLNFRSFNQAINDLLLCTPISGAVTFNVKAGQTFTETALIPAIPSSVGSSALTPVIFQRSGSGANPKIVPYYGTGATDAIITLSGASYITFDGIDLTENASNAPAAAAGQSSTCMEYGYYIKNESATVGASYNTIKNCTVTLNRANYGDVGVYQNTAFTPTSAGGTNSYNTYQSIYVTNAYRGMLLTGYNTATTALQDFGNIITNCSIGGSGAGDIGAPSNISSGTFSSAAASYTFGIEADNQNGISVHDCEVKNVKYNYSAPNIASPSYGIFLNILYGTSSLYNNKVHDIIAAKNSTGSHIRGVSVVGAASSTVNIYNNSICQVGAHGSSNTSNQQTQGLFIDGTGTTTMNLYYNSVYLTDISGISMYLGATQGLYMNNVTAVVKNNIFRITYGSSVGNNHHCIFIAGGTYSSTSDYNILDCSHDGTLSPYKGFWAVKYLATDIQTVATWKANPYFKDLNSPVTFTNSTAFLGAGDLHLNLAADDVTYHGVQISTPGDPISITTDFENIDLRAIPLIGCDEKNFLTPSVLISASNAPLDSNVAQGSTTNVLFGMNATAYVTANTLTGITVNAAGTFAASTNTDFTNFKFWWSTSSTFSATNGTATNVGPVYGNTPATNGPLAFTGLSVPLPIGTTVYFYITNDVGNSAVVPHTIQISPVDFALITLGTSVTKDGTSPLSSPEGQGIETVRNFWYNWGNEVIGQPSDVLDLNSWYDSTNAATPSYSHPSDFTSPNQVYCFIRPGATMSGPWSVSGNNTRVQVGLGVLPVTFTATQDIICNPTPDIVNKPNGATGNQIDVKNAATLQFQIDPASVQLGTLSTGSTVEYGDPGSVVNSTILTANYHNLILSGTGGSRTFNSSIGIAGAFTPNSYTSCPVTGSTIDFNGSAAQNIPAFTFDNLVVSNGSSVKTLTGNIAIQTSLKLNNTISLQLANFNLNLLSTATQTARLRSVTTAANILYGGTGLVFVQRYIPAKRGWRLITAPIDPAIAAGTHYISEAWQEQGNTNTTNGRDYSTVAATSASNTADTVSAGYATLITGGAIGSGFDQGYRNGASIKYYNAGSWPSPNNTNNTKVTAMEGWMLFVRGDRQNYGQITDQYKTPVTTTLRPRGRLFIGTKTVNAPVGGGLKVVGNPYASAVDYSTMTRNGSGWPVEPTYYVWDPYQGGVNGVGAFVTMKWNGTDFSRTIPNTGPPETASSSTYDNRYIPSGAAILVDFPSGSNLQIKETDKNAFNTTTAFRPMPGGGKLHQMRTLLNTVNTDKTTFMSDGALTWFSNNYSNEVDADDARKIGNMNENLVIEKSSNELLSIECRKIFEENDTVFYGLYRLKKNTYQLHFIMENLERESSVRGFLEDIYLKTKTPVSMKGETKVDFTVADDAGSAAKDRFRMVFRRMIRFTNVNANVLNNDIAVDWKVADEFNISKYEVERSTDGISFSSICTKASAGNSEGPVQYNQLDPNPAPGVYFYRIKTTGNDGVTAYSDAVQVKIVKSASQLYVFPNPVTNGMIQLQLGNTAAAGKYSIKLLSSTGQLINSEVVSHTGGTATKTIRPAQVLTNGNYQLEVVAPDKKVSVIKVLVSKD